MRRDVSVLTGPVFGRQGAMNALSTGEVKPIGGRAGRELALYRVAEQHVVGTLKSASI
jgi:hypothetical protein